MRKYIQREASQGYAEVEQQLRAAKHYNLTYFRAVPHYISKCSDDIACVSDYFVHDSDMQYDFTRRTENGEDLPMLDY